MDMADIFTTGSNVEIWQKAKAELANSIARDTYESWFKDIQFEGGDESCIKLSAEGEFATIWIRDNYMDILSSHVSMAAGRSLAVELISREEPSPSLKEPTNPDSERVISFKAEPAPLPKSINPRNTFENFVVGESNRFAHAAAMAVAQNVGVAYNPLLIYGATGLGKTHLMHAIAHFVLRNNPSAKIAYISSEAFVNEYVDAILKKSLVNFRRRYRNTDVLLIDDVQFFAGKEGCQEEFFHTFNELFNSGKQIVLSCDKSVNEVPDIEPRLVTRIGWGVSVDIQSPDYETRLAILRKKLAERGEGVNVDPAVLEFLARRFTKNVRRMEGALNNIVSYAILVNAHTPSASQPISVEKAQEILANSLGAADDNKLVDIELIQRKTAEYYKISVNDIVGKCRTSHIALARQVAMYLSRHLTSHSLKEIGARFGGRDHATVIHALHSIEDLMVVREELKHSVDLLTKSVL